MKSLLFLFAATAAVAAHAQLYMNRTEPDLDDLYARLSECAYVVKGRTVGVEGVGRRVLFPGKRAGDVWEFDARNLEFGWLFTVEVKEVICRPLDVVGDAGATSAPAPRRIHIFIPPGEPLSVQSKYGSNLRNSRERLAQGQDYLLFLYELPRQDVIVETFKLDPGFTYYRTVEGHRGAVALPDEAHPEKPRDFVAPLVQAVTRFCEAMKGPDAATKIRQLQGVRGSFDYPAWRQSVDRAIQELQGPPRRVP